MDNPVIVKRERGIRRTNTVILKPLSLHPAIPDNSGIYYEKGKPNVEIIASSKKLPTESEVKVMKQLEKNEKFMSPDKVQEYVKKREITQLEKTGLREWVGFNAEPVEKVHIKSVKGIGLYNKLKIAGILGLVALNLGGAVGAVIANSYQH